MADHHQPTAAAAAAAGAYTQKQIDESVAFMVEILSELEEDVGKEFVGLLCGFKEYGGGTDAVVSRAAELLRGHPDVLRRFTARIYMDVPVEERLALTMTRTRRTSRRRSERRDTHQTPAAAAPPNVAAASWNHRADNGLRLADAGKALTFVKRVYEKAGPVVHARFLAVLSEAKRSEDMAADEIYDRAKRAFGPAHVALLHEFATVWLPGEHEWKLQQQARGGPARQRHRAATAASSHAAAGMPDANKKPRADDDGNNGRRHDHVIAVLEVREVNKRRRSDDDDGTYTPWFRAKKPHSGNGEFSGSAAAARLLGAADATGVHHAYSDNNDKKPPRRRAAAIGGKGSSAGTAAVAGPKQQQQPERDGEVRRFRREWEFQTWYSKLVATSDRVTELLQPPRTPHGVGDGSGGGNRSLEALFPLPECREFLHNFYGGRWGEMRAALELGESRVPALKAIERRLTAKEEEAVVEESRKRRRHDPGRVAQRLHGLATDYSLDEECQPASGGTAAVHERRACFMVMAG